MDLPRFAQLLGVHATTVYRWELAAGQAIRIEPLQLQLLSVLQQQLHERQRTAARNELAETITKGLLVGGTMLGLFKLLDAAFSGASERQTGGAVRRATGARRKSSPTKRKRKTK